MGFVVRLNKICIVASVPIVKSGMSESVMWMALVRCGHRGLNEVLCLLHSAGLTVLGHSGAELGLSGTSLFLPFCHLHLCAKSIVISLYMVLHPCDVRRHQEPNYFPCIISLYRLSRVPCFLFPYTQIKVLPFTI